MEQEKRSGRANRTIRGIIIRPKQQIRMAVVLVTIGLMFLAVPLVVVTLRMTKFISDIEATNPIVAVYLAEFTAPALKMISIYAVVFAIFTVLVGIFLSHKIYGPLVPLLRHAENLRNRDYSSRVHLRANDEFTELADALNNLAEGLQNSQKKG